MFDFHHQKFCPGSFNEKEALFAAMATWPKGVRPVVHWSESQEGRIPHAHSDYISVRPSISLTLSSTSSAALCMRAIRLAGPNVPHAPP